MYRLVIVRTVYLGAAIARRVKGHLPTGTSQCVGRKRRRSAGVPTSGNVRQSRNSSGEVVPRVQADVFGAGRTNPRGKNCRHPLLITCFIPEERIFSSDDASLVVR
ncbi:Hypp5022 [Branchiostoma lanceolatum]|uniref:Hypp5022 protein n=1 Tax=Branchiostoma lanceolatum TaxID=7740 RepID=A0A8K0F391_BRALA|nr:Hypp5022 [Branchiostoma lanceolatum]